jgi:hypothetical protein
MIMLRVVALLLAFITASQLDAADFAIELSARTAKQPAVEAVHASTSAKPRAVLQAPADTPVTVKWTVRNRDDAIVKDVLVHFVVVRIDKPDQQEVPKLTKGVAAESALTMDFRPKDRTEGELTFTVREAGCYLIRLELKGASGKDEREPHTALDLLVR